MTRRSKRPAYLAAIITISCVAAIVSTFASGALPPEVRSTVEKLAAPVFRAWASQSPLPATTTGSGNLFYGNPSAAGTSPNNYFFETPYFVGSYNNSKGQANWIGWRLVAADSGKAPRFEFYPDPNLPSGFQVILPADYSNSGFDRGHICSHDDRSATNEASYATFVMTNIFPQTAELNRGPWLGLEKYCRQVARAGYVLYIFAGGVGEGGVGYRGARRSFSSGNRKITVPAYCWKVVLILDRTETINARTRMIAVMMPNTNRVSEVWTDYLTTPRDIELVTGFTFFSDAPEEVQQGLHALKTTTFAP